MEAREKFESIGWTYVASCTNTIEATYEKRIAGYDVCLYIIFEDRRVHLSHSGAISMDMLIAIQMQVKELRW